MLHRLALIQQVPSAADDEVDADDLRRLASTLAADEIQLFYQIALHGRNEMHLAPDEYAGFTMALMRMLAFAPIEAASARPAAGPASAATAGTRGRCVGARSAAVEVRGATAGRCAIKCSGTFRW